MRHRVHSTRLAVSLLLGIMFVPFVANSAFALTIPSQPTQLASNTDYCAYDKIVKMEHLYKAFSMLPYEKKDIYLSDSIVIAQEKSEKASSITPSKTVLKKVDTNDLTVEVTPAPVEVTPNPVSQITETPLAGQSGTVLNAETLFSMVNSYRASIGLSPFEKDPRVCEIVASRAPELDNEVWGNSYMHAGFKARNLPYWATENMISMRTEQEALTWWLNSPVHRSAIQGNYKYACLACAGKSCAMIFTNFDPKVRSSVQVTDETEKILEPLNK